MLLGSELKNDSYYINLILTNILITTMKTAEQMSKYVSFTRIKQ